MYGWGEAGTAALFAHFVGWATNRVVASIIANPGHYDPVGVDKVQLPEKNSPHASCGPELPLAVELVFISPQAPAASAVPC